MNSLDQLIQKMNIMVIDDMLSVRSIVKSSLVELGVEHVELHSDAESAWSKLHQTDVDMIICDWGLPAMSGLEFLKKVKAKTSLKHIPFLMLTGTTEKSRVMDAIQAGVNDYLTKPFQPQQLQYRVLKLLKSTAQ